MSARLEDKKLKLEKSFVWLLAGFIVLVVISLVYGNAVSSEASEKQIEDYVRQSLRTLYGIKRNGDTWYELQERGISAAIEEEVQFLEQKSGVTSTYSVFSERMNFFSSLDSERLVKKLKRDDLQMLAVVSPEGIPLSVFPIAEKPVGIISGTAEYPYNLWWKAVEEAHAKRRIVSTGFFPGRSAGAMLFAMVVPLSHGDSSASVIIVFQERFYSNLFNTPLLDEYSFVWMIGSDGRIIHHPVPSIVGVSLSDYSTGLPELPAIFDFLGGEASNTHMLISNPFGDSYKDEKLLLVMSRLKVGPHDVVLAASAPQREVTRHVNATMRRLLSFAFSAVAVALIIVLIWSKFKTAEIRSEERKDITQELDRMVEARTVELNFVTRTIKDLIDSIPSALIVLDRNLRILLVNLSFYSILSPSVSSATGRDIGDIFSDEFKRRLNEVMKSKKPVIDVEMRKRVEGQGEKILMVSVLHLLGKRDRLLLVIDDVSERRILERQLIQAEKMAGLGTLMSGIAHEINNPLNAISGMAQIMVARSKDEETVAGAQEIRRYVNRVAEIVKELSRYSRSSKVTDMVQADINKVIEEALEMVSHSRHFKEVSIEKNFSYGLPSIKVNIIEIEQVFINMLTNAFDAVMEKKQNVPELEPRVRITTNLHEERFIHVAFTDNGTGIPSDILQSIFDPFFTTKDQGVGTGLGLSISYKIIQRYGGVILADTKPGEGTTFIIRLPIA